MQHASDCAQHNEPAYPNGPCDCGAVLGVTVNHKEENSGRAYDALVVRMWVTLPSGRRLAFSDIEPGEYDSDAEIETSIEQRKLDILRALAEIASHK